MLKTYAFMSLALFSLTTHAGEIKNISVIIKEHSNLCDKNSNYYKQTGKECAVKKARFETRNYSNFDPGDVHPYHGTLAYFGFETNTWEDITKYGFVQQIRGCTFEKKKNADGTITKRIGETIMHLGEKRVYVFPDWSIDATTNDPLYYGPLEEDAHLPGGRVSLYRWTPKLGVIDSKKTKDLYQMLQLPLEKRQEASPSVFVTDTPSMAYMRDEENKVFQNISLEFNICLYDVAEIPLTIDNDAPMTGVPIVCHKWNSQFEFNFDKNKFEHLPNKGLDPFCASQLPRNPSDVFAEESRQKQLKR
jgi:hypothetical protein